MKNSKKTLFSAFARSGLGSLAGALSAAQGKYYIAAYHNLIKDRFAHFPFDLNNVSADEKSFEEQLEYYRANFNVIHYSTLKDHIGKGRPGKPPLVITFDDAYRSFYTIAAPLLEKYGLPSTVFIATALADVETMFWWDEVIYICKATGPGVFYKEAFSDFFIADIELLFLLNSNDEDGFYRSLLRYLRGLCPEDLESFLGFLRKKYGPVSARANAEKLPVRTMDWGEIRALTGSDLVEFGSHSVTHRQMGSFSESEFRSEITLSKKSIEANTGKGVTSFCYPYGVAPAGFDVSRPLRDAGYRFACLMQSGYNRFDEPEFLQKRIPVELSTETSELDCQMRLPAAMLAIGKSKAALAQAMHFAAKIRAASRVLPSMLSMPREEANGTTHLFIAICDHYEPYWRRADYRAAYGRVKKWADRLPAIFESHHDSDGRTPKYCFFYPEEEYNQELLNMISAICANGYGEAGIHLHHDKDTAENLRRRLIEFKNRLAGDHGLLSTGPDGTTITYDFIHGNWALDNSGPCGRWCGVNNELTILRETGCYADFTMPSAPHPTQSRKINAIYYAKDAPSPRSYDRGTDAEAGKTGTEGFLMVPGPLFLRFSGTRVKIENGGICGDNPPAEERVDAWVKNGISIKGRPGWKFIKLYTHGTQESVMRMFFEDGWMERFLSYLEGSYNNSSFKLHYVSSREMVNVIHAVESGAREWDTSLLDFRYRLIGGRGPARLASTDVSLNTGKRS